MFIRVGGHEGRLYLDLCDDSWRAVEITKDGWRVIDRPPVSFRRSKGMQALPAPEAGGSIESLRPFLNVRDDAEFVLVVAWLLSALRDQGPYPVLAVSGEQGSAKSTLVALIRQLVDPNTAPLRALPRHDRDMFIAANNGHVLAFDNVSGLSGWISDTLCRLSTGGGFAVRQLYTDQDEVLFEATRPIILNGIEEVVERSDLADRAVILTLPPIPEEDRRPEQEFWAVFEAELPRILGALLDAAVEGLKRLADTHLAKPPRMADFAKWVTACENALWQPGTFLSAYSDNRDEAADIVSEADLVASAIRNLMAAQGEWPGTATQLLRDLAGCVDEGVSKSRTWPRTPRFLGGKLRRAAPFLRKAGVKISWSREGHKRTRTIRITTASEDEIGASASSANTQAKHRTDGSGPGSTRTAGNGADGPGDAASSKPSGSSANGGSKAAADDADASLQYSSAARYVRGEGRPPDEARDWQHAFDERAGISEYCGGSPRHEAELYALECCAEEWVRCNPIESEPGRCLFCGGSDQDHDPVRPYGSATTASVFVHPRCWPAYVQKRKVEGVMALISMGIRLSNHDLSGDKKTDVGHGN